jgi:hypothetical protein
MAQISIEGEYPLQKAERMLSGPIGRMLTVVVDVSE